MSKVIKASPANKIESISVNLSNHPVAFKEKVQELVECGMDRNEAEKYVRNTPIVLEIYYEKGLGLFAVESEALEGGADLVSPYSKKPIVVPDD